MSDVRSRIQKDVHCVKLQLKHWSALSQSVDLACHSKVLGIRFISFSTILAMGRTLYRKISPAMVSGKSSIRNLGLCTPVSSLGLCKTYGSSTHSSLGNDEPGFMQPGDCFTIEVSSDAQVLTQHVDREFLVSSLALHY